MSTVKDKEKASNKEPEGIFPRRYFLIAGAYLVTVVLLLSLVVLRWGKTPAPELPGFERGMEGALLDAEGGDEKLQPAPGVEEEQRANGSGSVLKPALEEEISVPEGRGGELPAGTEQETESKRAAQGAEEYAAAQLLFPQAASPLPRWELHSSFGSYVTEKLPSGGSLHRLARGAYFQAPPGAPVSALWDGQVVKVWNSGSHYSSSVLLEHEGGYCTFYSNLREVWVGEGRYVSRGENIGLLPYSLPMEADQENAPAEEPGPVPIKTIWKGYAGEEVAAQPEAGSEPAEDNFLPVSAFNEGNPLLYLEVRLENNFLDPLQFIPARN